MEGSSGDEEFDDFEEDYDYPDDLVCKQFVYFLN